jgi:hypothetical protein
LADGRKVLAALSGILTVAGGRPSSAQVVTEWGPAVTVATAEPAVFAGGSWGIRPGTRDRLVIGAGLGAADGALAGRGEAIWHFLLHPRKARGPALYAGGGVAAAYAREWRGYLVVTAGVDWSPGGRSGWMAEVGIGGGLRVVAGYRWRRNRG